MGAIPQIRKKLQSPLGKTRQRNQVHPLVPHCFYCSRQFVRRSFPSLSIVPRLHRGPLFFRPLCCHVMASLSATVCLASAWHPSPSHPFLPFLGCPVVRLQVSSSFVHCPAIASRPSSLSSIALPCHGIPLCHCVPRVSVASLLPILFFPFSGALWFACRSLPPLFIVPRLHRGPLFFRPLPCPAMSWHPSLPLCASRQRGIILPILFLSRLFTAIASRHFFPLSGARRFNSRDYQKRPRRSEAPIINAAIKQAL